MKICVVTGLCGSGKTFYCQHKNTISYDTVYSYSSKKINYNIIDNLLEKYKDVKEIYLDGFNNELIEYIFNKLNLTFDNLNFILIYTEIDEYYDIIACKEPRQFNEILYTRYVDKIINSIIHINKNIKQLNNNIIYKYRKNDIYIDYVNDEHLNNILNETSENRLLRFIDNTSGAKYYQSILLHEKYIRKGTEQDWLTFEKILNCTSLKDKIVCDTGCFNGYFSFKSISEGAKKVIGIDHNNAAINICNKIAIYNNQHLWQNGIKTDTSCELGIHFYENKIGKDIIFDEDKITPKIDIIFALNYLHHLKNELGKQAFIDTVDSFFKNTSEIIFEINENEIDDIYNLAVKNKFVLIKKIESHRKTSFGNRYVIYFKK